LDDWGADATWRVGLSEVLKAVSVDGDDVVRSGVAETVARLLATRLRLVADELAHPEIVTAGVERPVIILGLPRTGTTLLHAMLAADPDARAPEAWEAAAPWPAPDLASYDRDPRIEVMQARLDALTAARPEIATMHEWGARLPAECNEITMMHFASTNFWARFGLPGYTRWLAEERADGKYLTHRRVLQQLQWKGPRGRWALKSPEHLLDLPALLDTYPDACLVWTHREPAQVLPSLASLIFTVRSMRLRQVDPAEVGASVLAVWGAALERATADRQQAEVEDACFDIAFARLVADPIGVVSDIYERFDLPFSTEYEKRLRARLEEENDAQPRGRHVYRAEDFGLASGNLAEAFPFYRQRFAPLLRN
jgi:hypothetical protein